MNWATGLARVVGIHPHGITVACPHCGETHEHTRIVLGSKAVVAGCHTGFGRLREYRIAGRDN